MKHTRSLAFAFLSVTLTTTSSQAQTSKQIPYIHSAELIKQGVAENDKGNYKKALSYYDQIPEGDSNYVQALYERSLTNINDSNFVKGIDLAKQALALNSPEKRGLMLNMAAAFDYSGRTDVAIKMYDSISVLYPLDNRPYFEKAIIKYKQKDFTAAQQLLEHSLMLNPRHFRSHFLLGSTYAFQGRLAESMMALSASLLCTSDYDIAKNPIAILSSIANQTDDVAEIYNNRKTENRDPAFDEIDEIIHAKLALNKGYQLKTELSDNIFRQLQVMMEKLEYDAQDSNFVMQYYVPLYSRIFKQDQFEPFILQLFSNFGFKSIDKMNDSHKGKARLQAISDMIYPYIDSIFGTQVLNYQARQKAVVKYHAYTDDNSIIEGVYSDPKTQKFAAGKVTLYKNQSLTAVGNYNAGGEKEGVWKYYYPSGKIRLIEELKNGKPIHTDTTWYENGVVKSTTSYNADGLDIESSENEYSGQPDNTAVMKAKGEYEFTYYTPYGGILSKQTYTDKKMKDGTYIVYYNSGKKKKEFTYKGDKLNGPYLTYFENGQIDERADYVNGQLEGDFKSYYEDGKLEREYINAADKKQGASISYRRDGSVYSKFNYNKGKADGDCVFFNKAGKQYGVITYKNGHALQTKFVMPDGKEINGKLSDENSTLSIYNEYGAIIKKLKMDKEGNLQGKNAYNFEWGGLREETNYLNDLKNGISTTYYQNGNVNVLRQYKNDTADGYYQYMNINGTMQSEGWLKDGVTQGTWRSYYASGVIQSEYFMVDGTLNGPDKNYDMSGKLDYIKHYDNGMIIGLTQYDTSGKVLQDVTFDKGNGHFKLIFPNGATRWECDLKYGKYSGTYIDHNGNNTIASKGTFVNGKFQGDFENYHPNGKLSTKGHYSYGEQDGTRIEYSIGGLKEHVSQYVDGEKNGMDSTFDGGILTAVRKYRNDDVDSAAVMYGENGKIAGIVYYDLGTVIGYTYEDKEGKLLPMKPVVNGSAHVQTFYANGSKALDWTIDKNSFQGKQLSYFSNGQIQQEINYEKGMLNGAFHQFNPDGSNLYEGTYKDGLMQGIRKMYDNKGKQISVVNFTDDVMNGNATDTDASGKSLNLWYYYGSVIK